MADRDLGFNFFAQDKGATAVFTQMANNAERLAKKLDELDRKIVDPKIKADTKEAEREVGAFAAKMRRTIDAAVRSLPDIELHAKSTEVDREIARVRRELQSLSDKRVGIDIGAEEAQREVQRLERELLALGRRSPNVQVRADVAAALAQLRTVDGAADRVSRNNVHLTARVDGDQALSMLGLITGALAVLGATAPAALATLAAAPALGGALAQGLGAGAAGFSGIADAMSEMEANQKKLDSATARGASSGAVSAAQRVAQTDRVAAAHRALEQAENQETRSAIQGQWQLQDAQRGVQEAEASARRANAAATAELDDRTRDLLQSTVDLQEAMGVARKEEREDGFDYRDSVFAEEDADKRLTEAKKALAEARAKKTDPDDLADLVGQADRAQLALERAQARLEDAQDAQDEWAAHGVRGSDTVRAAQERVQQAADAVREAQAEQTRTGIEGARQVGLAEQQRGRTAEQVAWAEQDATRQVAEAKIALAQASRVTATASGGAAAAVKKETEAWDKLSPAGQRFATFLESKFQPAWRGVRNSIQASMLPKVQSSMEQLDAVIPLVSDKLSDTGDVIGRLSQQGADMVTSGPWQRDFATIMDRNNRILEDFGHAGLSSVDSMRMITVAGGPLAERISRVVEKQAALGTEWLRGKYASGELQRMIDRGARTFKEYAQDVGDIAMGFIQFAAAASPIGHILLDILAAGGRFVSSMPPGLLTVVASTVAAGVAVGKLGTLVAGLNATGKVTRSGLGLLSGVLDRFVPRSVGTRIDNAALSVGGLAERFTGSAKAGEKVASASSRVGRVAGGLVGGLGVLGAVVGGVALATELFGASQEEAAARQEQNRNSVKDLTQALVDSGGAITANVRAMKLKEIQDATFPGTTDDVSDAFKKLSINTRDVTTAVLSSGKPFDDMRAKLQAIIKAGTQEFDTGHGVITKVNDNAKLAMQALQYLEDQAGNTKNALQQARESLNDALTPKNEAVSKTQQLATAIQKVADASGDASAQGAAYADFMDRISGRSKSVAEAQSDVFKAISRVKELQGDYSDVVNDNTGAIDGFTKKGSELTDTLTPMAEKFFSLGSALRSQGKSVPETAAALQKVRDQLYGMLRGMNLSDVEANKLLDSFGLFPKQVATNFSATGMSKVQAGITALLAATGEVTQGGAPHTIHLAADDTAARDSLTTLGFKVHNLPDGSFEIYADSEPGKKQLDQMLQGIDHSSAAISIFANTRPGTIRLGEFIASINNAKGVTTIDGDTKPGDKKAGDFKLRIDSTTGRITIDGDEREGKKVLRDLVDRVNRSKGWAKIHGDPWGKGLAADEVRELKRWIGDQNATLPVELRIKQARQALRVAGLTGTLDLLPRKADGGPIVGPGTATSDSVLMWSPTAGPWRGSKGEHVVTDREVRGAGGHAEVQRQRDIWRTAPGHAGGGPVGARRPVALSAAAQVAAGLPAGAGRGGASVLIGGLDPAASAKGMAALQVATEDLTRKALLPLAKQVDDRTAPSLRLIDLQARTRAAAGVTRLGDVTAAQSTRMKRDWSQAGQRVDQATAGMGRDIRALQQQHVTSFDRMADASGASVRRITGQQLPALRSGARQTGTSFATLRDIAAAEMRSFQRAVADPTRWTLRNPFNRGIISGVNVLARQFDLKQIPRVPVGFAGGGRVYGPGTGTSDSIPALIDGRDPAALSTGEYVMPEARTAKHFYFLEALRRGDPEAEQAAGGAYARGPRRYRDGGLVADTGSEHAAQLARGAQFAARQSGKPYIWGGTGPAGFDCSGFISAITQAILGGPTTQRLFSTASFAGGPTAGFVPGLHSAWGVGVFQGSPGHIAGTLAGVNAESGGSHGDVRFGPPAVGALHPQFRQHFSLPVVGGRFTGGGGSFDPRSIVESAFAGVDRMIDSIGVRWPQNAMARVDAGAARSTSDGVQGALAKRLERMFTTSAGSSAGAGRWKAYARAQLGRHGWGPAEFAPLDSLWTKESGWNPRADNPGSSAYGIPQALPGSKMAVAGPDWMTNGATQIDWGLGYIDQRYGSPSAAWAHSQAVNWYDGGGIWPTHTPGWNGSGGDELVLDRVETDDFRRMVRILDSPRGQQMLAPAAAPSMRQAVAEGRTVVINVHGTDPVAAGREMKRLFDFELGR